MRLRHIEVFHAVFTCGSITAAAKHLNVSQPSVSKVLSHAELQLGYPLFDRVRGKLVPTREAERLIGLVSGVYQGIDELRKVAENLGSEDPGRIRIAATPAFGIEFVPRAVATFRQAHPGQRFEVETSHLHQVTRALNQSRIDLGLVFHPFSEPGVTAEILAPAEFVVVMKRGEKLPGADRIAMGALADIPFVRLSDRGPLGHLLSRRMESSGISLGSDLVAETYQMAMALVAHGGGATIIDEITAHSANPDELHVQKLVPPLTFNIAVLYKEDQPLSNTARKFISHLREQLSQFLET